MKETIAFGCAGEGFGHASLFIEILRGQGPFTANASQWAGIPLLNLNHPGIVLRFFSVMSDALRAKGVARLMMPPARETLICSFYQGDIGPIIRREIKEAPSSAENHIVVYGKSSFRERLKIALKDYPQFEYLYFPNKKGDFAESLASCRAVIAPAGHQLLSEALSLKKPIIAFPHQGQFEQRLNAQMLERSGRGHFGRIEFLKPFLDRFFRELSSFPKPCHWNENFFFRDDTERAVKRVRYFIEKVLNEANPFHEIPADLQETALGVRNSFTS